MEFGSIEFLLYFLPLFLFVYWIVPGRLKNMMLLIGSIIFYGYREPVALVPLAGSVVVNYLFGAGLAWDRRHKRHLKRKILLFLGVACNVGVLAAFKLGIMPIEMPPGISFYTFSMISYLADVYRRETPREMRFICLANYAAMFPKLLCGPITRYREMRADMAERRFDADTVQEGLGIFIMGLTYKVLLADRIGLLWNRAHTIGYESLSTPYAWLAAVAYSMKLYFDFYGYSLMAQGLGGMLGFSLPDNFRDPYMAKGVRDFYRRWHITLGRWFRDYVYIPMGGSRRGMVRTVLNLLAVWLLTACWHGPGLNFLLWGGLLWVFIVLENLWAKAGLAEKCRRLGFLTYPYIWIVIPVTWVCFAVPDMGELYTYLGRMFGFVQGISVREKDWIWALEEYGGLFVAGAAGCTPLLRFLYEKGRRFLAGKLLLAILFWMCVWRISVAGNNPFMYLNF